jgi:hypothetical protein
VVVAVAVAVAVAVDKNVPQWPFVPTAKKW